LIVIPWPTPWASLPGRALGQGGQAGKAGRRARQAGGQAGKPQSAIEQLISITLDRKTKIVFTLSFDWLLL